MNAWLVYAQARARSYWGLLLWIVWLTRTPSLTVRRLLDEGIVYPAEGTVEADTLSADLLVVYAVPTGTLSTGEVLFTYAALVFHLERRKKVPSLRAQRSGSQTG